MTLADTGYEQIRLLIVTGYLGSGKTTLLKSLRQGLEDNITCRFLVNEAGEVALDQAVYTLGADEATVLAGGCACCVRREALIAALRETVEAMDRSRPGWLVVETSGLANPAPILFSVLEDDLLKHHVTIAGIVTTLGCEEGEAVLANHPEALQQLAMADAVVLTKADRVDGETLQQRKQALARYAVGTPVFTAGSTPLDWSRLLDRLLRQGSAARGEILPSADAGHADITPCVIEVSDALDWQAFGVWLSALLAAHGEAIVRVKGVIPVHDWQAQTFHVLINGVQHIVHPPEHVNDPERLPQHPALIFFLRGIEAQQIRQSLHGFLARFASRH